MKIAVIICLVLSVIAILATLWERYQYHLSKREFERLISRRFGSDAMLNLPWQVTDAIRKQFDERLTALATEEVLQKSVDSAVEELGSKLVKSELADRIVQAVNSEVLLEIKKKHMTEVLAQMDTKAIANAITLSAAQSIIERDAKRSRY